MIRRQPNLGEESLGGEYCAELGFSTLSVTLRLCRTSHTRSTWPGRPGRPLQPRMPYPGLERDNATKTLHAARQLLRTKATAHSPKAARAPRKNPTAPAVSMETTRMIIA